jgi:hypothetical protein
VGAEADVSPHTTQLHALRDEASLCRGSARKARRAAAAAAAGPTGDPQGISDDPEDLDTEDLDTDPDASLDMSALMGGGVVAVDASEAVRDLRCFR